MNWPRIGSLALQGGVGIGLLIILGLMTALAIVVFALLWSIIGPVVERFGIATLALVPLGFGIMFIGWTMAGHVIKYIEKEYGPWS